MTLTYACAPVVLVVGTGSTIGCNDPETFGTRQLLRQGADLEGVAVSLQRLSAVSSWPDIAADSKPRSCPPR